MKHITCAIIGRPSCGKSTFINTVCENKVSIVSSVPQSTITSVRGVYKDKRGSIVFTDTPGLHIDSRQFNMRLTKQSVNAIRNSDCILYVLDAQDRIGDEEKKTAFYASTSKKPVIAFINKTDVAKPDDLSEKRAFVAKSIDNAKILEGSALNDTGLDEVLIEIFSLAEDTDDEVDFECWTDSPLEFRIAEEIRQVIFDNTHSEIPHSVFVDVENIKQVSDDRLGIDATIFTEHSSQKGILIGKGGNMIKKIRTTAQKNIKKIFPDYKIDLFLNIKVHPKWKKDKRILDKLNL